MASRKRLVESEYLLLRHRRGEKDALERLVRLWEEPLYYYVRRLVAAEDDARDLTQQIWLKAILKLETLRDPAAFPAWLYRLAQRHVLSHLRRTTTLEPLGDVPADNDPDTGKPEVLSSWLTAEEVHWGLGHLSMRHRECLTLQFLEGFSIEEISGIIGVPVGTVKSRIHYAKKALRKILRGRRNCCE